MEIKQKAAAFISGIGLAANLGLADIVKAEEWYNPKGWAIPNVANAKFLGQAYSDTIKEIPGKETLQKGYRSSDGTLFNTLEYKGRIYGFYMDTNGEMPMEFTLLDRDNDGIFEYKSSGQEWPTPEYLKTALKE